MLEARIWMKKSDKNYLGKGRIELLERIREHGSIFAAAKAMKMSYKAAWDLVDAMNKLSASPLVEKTSGGKGGGGTILTQKGHQVIEAFKLLMSKHQQFLDIFEECEDIFDIVTKLDHLSLKLSARNHIGGTVTAIHKDVVKVTVELAISANEKIYSMITQNSLTELGATIGTHAIAIVKASFVSIDNKKPTTTHKNIFKGKIIQLLSDTENSEVTLELESKNIITSTMPNSIFIPLGLRINDEAYVHFDASDVILGV